MGCSNTKVDNSARRPSTKAPAKSTKARGRGAAQEDGENDNNNNTAQKSQATIKSKSNSRISNKGAKTKGNNNNNYNEDEFNDEKKRSKVAVNEKGYKKRIRENLRNASAGTDIEQLEKAMEIFANNKLEDGGDYSEAQDRMEYLMLRKDIKDACMRNHPVVLDKSIQKVEASPYKRQLKPYLDRAYYLKQHQNDLGDYMHDISNMEQSTISEIRSYNHPPDGVHETMIATYMICGYPEEHLTDWSEITALMGRYGKDSLIREVQGVDQKNIDKQTALRARHYLGQYTLEEIRSVSNGAAAFYVWSSRMVGKHDVDKKTTQSGNSRLTNSKRNSQPTTQTNSATHNKTNTTQNNKTNTAQNKKPNTTQNNKTNTTQNTPSTPKNAPKNTTKK